MAGTSPVMTHSAIVSIKSRHALTGNSSPEKAKPPAMARGFVLSSGHQRSDFADITLGNRLATHLAGFLDHLGFFTSVDGSVFFRRINVGADFTLGLELAY